MNECSTGNNACASPPNGTCTNTIGSYLCSCNPGYMGNGRTCVDINECLLRADNCSINANCINNIGSFQCSCQLGFTGNGYSCCMFINQCCVINNLTALCIFSVCNDGQMKLFNGSSSSEGTVQMCYNNNYGTVCDDKWNELDAMVVCRALNLTCRLPLAHNMAVC